MPPKTAVAITVFSAMVTIAGVNFAGAQVYTPLVQIPGLPPGGAVNLSMYLVGLYDFLLSIVGIVAVMMLIIGGMRYITAAGNQAAVSDAKDMITSALAGLLLAILSWVIVAEINPDVLYIKKPGGDFVDTQAWDFGECGRYGPTAAPVCTCKYPPPAFSFVLAGPTSQAECNKECRLQGHCGGEMSCLEAGTEDINGPHFYEIPIEDDAEHGTILGQGGECYCNDGEHIAPVGGNNCEVTCRTTNHCGWNFLVVRVNTDYIKHDADDTDTWEFTDPDRNRVHDFFLTNDGTWGAFNITADSYTPVALGPTYQCAVLVTARKTVSVLGVDIAGDYRFIFWAAEGTIIKRDGLSLEKDIASSGGYAQCCSQVGGPACDMNAIYPGCDGWIHIPPVIGPLFDMRCAHELFNARYDRLYGYGPNYDLICDPATGMWG